METTKTINSPFDEQTLQYFKELLLEKRREAEQQEAQVEENISNLNEADDADQSSIAHHMGDFGSDTEEKQLNYQFLERTRKYINQINDALQRIEDGTYGICKATGNPIAKGRLESVPHTRYSIEAKEQGLDHE
ncbi:transcriptional regulator, TraR/DksA family [Fodinibius roseus]|uniref:Transcriptional regulator, TraR/DksA family n=1 Tax=Fodinibius roseus TaxID=1194090 RepID=A0A1M4X5P7_9BACT|nr:TraR/DksA C4-type zinc finger protein [Fodinibius roseus]SHE88834.1 transcriptional regulator, TraR/DksA family [Fodinibius roseus]